MAEHVIIDGNNLLHALHAHAPLPDLGRETLVRVVERWARQGDDRVTIVFDGPTPPGGMSAQMSSSRITVRFSAPLSADDVIVAMVHRARDPGSVRVVTGDNAIKHETRVHRCRHTGAKGFVRELFPSQNEPRRAGNSRGEKPTELSPDDTEKWLEAFGITDEDEPFDGYDAMRY